jgi:hypothetical protein
VAVLVATGLLLVSLSPPSVAAAGSTPAGRHVAKAASPLVSVNAADYSVACTKVKGSLAFSQHLFLNSTNADTTTFSFNIKLKNCTATPSGGGAPITSIKGTLTGSVTATAIHSNGCVDVLAPGDPLVLSGSLTAAWVSTPALSSGNSVIKVKSGAFPDTPIPSQPSTYFIPGKKGAKVSGSFTGGNGGVDNLLAMVGGETPEQLGIGCIATDGLNSLPVASGYLDLGAPPTSIALSPSDTDANPWISGPSGPSYTAMATYPGGAQENVAAAATWNSSDPSVATITGEKDVVANGFTLAPGSTTISATFDGVTGSTSLTVVPDLVVTTTSVAKMTVGVPYDQTLTATGGTGPYVWSIAQGTLPDGLSLDPATGEITGMPTSTTQPEQVSVEAKDSSTPQEDASGSLIFDDAGPPTITTTSLPDFTTGVPYDQTLAVSGGTAPYTWTIPFGGLPEGLSLNPATGEITGTPTGSTAELFDIQVTDSSATPEIGSANLSIDNGPPVLPTELSDGNVGYSYGVYLEFDTNGGLYPYTFSVVSGSLPPGLSLQDGQDLVGLPTTAGTFAFTLQVEDSSSPQQTATQSYSMTIQS